MRSTRRRRQSGQSLVEVVVASALLGLAIVVGIEAVQAAGRAAERATKEAWATCIVRGELRAVLAADWSASGAYAAPPHVTVSAPPDPTIANLQDITVTATDPTTGAAIRSASALKSMRFSGSLGGSVDAASVGAGCG